MTEKDRPLCLVRPLLDVPKTRLVATLKAAKIPYADDPSNRDPRFARARLRGLMADLAAEGLSAARLALLARRLQRAERALVAASDRAAADLAVPTAVAGGLAYDAAGLCACSLKTRCAIGRAVGEAGAKARSARQAGILENRVDKVLPDRPEAFRRISPARL